MIGGHGSALGARVLADAIPVAFVPATIDRDIDGTGLDDRHGLRDPLRASPRSTSCGSPARSLPGRAFLVQTLGAPHGFLADAVAAAAGVDHVLVPERPIDLDAVAAALRDRAPTGAAIAVMSEAVGDAVRIGEELAARAGIRVHPTILGHAQRAAPPVGARPRDGPRGGPRRRDALANGRSSFVGLDDDGHVTPAPLGPPPRTKERSHEPRIRPTPVHPRLRPPDVLPDEAVRHRGHPTAGQREQMAEAKRIILQGLLTVAESAEPGTLGALTDEEHGAAAARAARRSGLALAMAAEKSSRAEFELEYGDAFAEHIEAFEPGLRQGPGPLRPRGRPPR